jgi:hypothetical protein
MEWKAKEEIGKRQSRWLEIGNRGREMLDAAMEGRWLGRVGKWKEEKRVCREGWRVAGRVFRRGGESGE